MTVTRRRLLHGLGMAGVTASASAVLPRFAFAQQPTPGPNGGFPPQSQIDADALRPRYHLAPVHGWMNDPCAPVYFNGRYHLFFQNNPNGSVWGNMSWAHAVSKDMVHWTLRPVALERTPGGPDSFGVFTGTMVFDEAHSKRIPTILYTCVAPSTPEQATLWNSHPPEREAQCIATPANSAAANNTVNGRAPSAAELEGLKDAALDTWDKSDKPVIPSPPPDMRVTGFRDPVPWREDDGTYYMLLASGQKGIGGNVLLYKSPDLRQWQYQGIFAAGKPTGKQTDDTVDSGETWECPDFFPLGGKHVLIHSAGTLKGRKTMWQSGTLDKRTMKWTAEKEGVLNHGPYYAPKTQLDAHGNRILWGWIPEDWTEAEMTKHGWSGCMSLPRIMTLDSNGEARFAPAPEVDLLRYPSINAALAHSGPVAVEYQTDTTFHLQRIGGNPPPVQIGANGLYFLELASDATRTSISFNGQDVSLNEPLPESVKVRVLIDHSVLEIFIGNRVVITARVYQRSADRAATRLVLPGTYLVVQASTAISYMRAL